MRTHSSWCLIVAGFWLAWPATAQERGGSPLIVPGKSVGEVRLGIEMEEVEKKLGASQVGDGAMGKGWSGWFAPKAGGGRGYELDIRSHVTATSHDQVAMEIRVESPFFHTKEGIRTGSSLAEIWKAFPGLRYSEHAQPKDRTLEVYADDAQGIAVEIRRTPGDSAVAWGVCQAIIVFDLSADGGIRPLDSMRDMPSER